MKLIRVLISILLLAGLTGYCTSCAEEPISSRQSAGCEQESTLQPGPHWVIEVNTMTPQPDLVLSVQHITTDHLVRVKHEEAITTLTFDSEAGEYKVGLSICGTGTSGLPYSIKVIKPNGTTVNINATVGTLYVVDIQ